MCMFSVLTTSARKYILDQYENINTLIAFLYNCAQIAICRVLATAVELQEMNWFLIDFKATLMS